MFTVKPQYSVEDFLKAIGFITPPGTTVEYFITPPGTNVAVPAGSGFQQVVNDVPQDESITYQRTEPVLKRDEAITPADYSIWQTQPLGKRGPAKPHLPPVTQPDDLKSPFVKIMNESRESYIDFLLTEEVKMFPKNTLVHAVFTKRRV
jgi:hypothetical protein